MSSTAPYPEQPSITTRPTPLHVTLSPSSALEQAQQHLREIKSEPITDLDTALLKLEEERRKYGVDFFVVFTHYFCILVQNCRCDRLTQLNNTLREQLEESHNTNEALTADLQKLTNDWEALREEMIIKEDEWKDEEQAFNDYYSTEHNRLLNLWRDVVSVKRLFIDVQTATERDLGKLKSEVNEYGRDLVTTCSRIERKLVTDSIVGVK